MIILPLLVLAAGSAVVLASDPHNRTSLSKGHHETSYSSSSSTKVSSQSSSKGQSVSTSEKESTVESRTSKTSKYSSRSSEDSSYVEVEARNGIVPCLKRLTNNPKLVTGIIITILLVIAIVLGVVYADPIAEFFRNIGNRVSNLISDTGSSNQGTTTTFFQRYGQLLYVLFALPLFYFLARNKAMKKLIDEHEHWGKTKGPKTFGQTFLVVPTLAGTLVFLLDILPRIVAPDSDTARLVAEISAPTFVVLAGIIMLAALYKAVMAHKNAKGKPYHNRIRKIVILSGYLAVTFLIAAIFIFLGVLPAFLATIFGILALGCMVFFLPYDKEPVGGTEDGKGSNLMQITGLPKLSDSSTGHESKIEPSDKSDNQMILLEE